MRPFLERYGDGYRIILGSDIVGHALRMANGQLGLFDADDRRLTQATYPSARTAQAAYIALQPPPASTGEKS